MVRVGDEDAIVVCALTVGESKLLKELLKLLKALDIETPNIHCNTHLSTFIRNWYKVLEVDFVMTNFY